MSASYQPVLGTGRDPAWRSQRFRGRDGSYLFSLLRRRPSWVLSAKRTVRNPSQGLHLYRGERDKTNIRPPGRLLGWVLVSGFSALSSVEPNVSASLRRDAGRRRVTVVGQRAGPAVKHSGRSGGAAPGSSTAEISSQTSPPRV